MAVDSGVVEQLEAQGMGAVREEQGLCALELVMLPAWGLPVSAMVPLQWPRLVMQMARGVPQLLQKLVADHMHLLQQHTYAVVELPTRNALINSLLQLPVSERAAQLEAMVLEHVANVSQQLDVGLDEPLMDAGLDSLAAIELVSQLSQSLGDGVVLSVTALFDSPTVSQLAAHIGSLLCWEEPAEAHTVQLTVSQGRRLGQESLAVASAGCVLPGTSGNSAKFWCLLSNAVDPICGVPSGRWDERHYAESSEQVADSKCYVQCGGFVAGLEGFDNTHFRISASEAKQMDPQQRAVLEVRLLCV
jgi:acyl carrier protein